MVAPVSAPRKNRRSTLLERRYAIALREDMGLSSREISRVTGFHRATIEGWCNPDRAERDKVVTRRWQQNNRQKTRQYTNEWRASNREEVRQQRRAQYWFDPERHRAYQRKYKAKKRATSASAVAESRGLPPVKMNGRLMTDAEAREQLDRRQGVCDLCGRVWDRELHLDHCHTTGAFRGCLCMVCNPALGAMEAVIQKHGSLDVVTRYLSGEFVA